MSGRGPPRTESMTTLKVDNLTYRTTCEDLRRVCLHTKRPFFSHKSWLRHYQVCFYISLSPVEPNCINVICAVGFMIDVMEKMLCMPWMEE